MSDLEHLMGLSDTAIREKLAGLGHPVGPITETTRKIIIRKLHKLMTERRNTSFAAYSSAEESDGGQRGSAARKRTSMPPPISTRRVASPRQSPSINSTISDFRDKNNGSVSGAGDSSPSLLNSRRSLSSRPSLRRGRKSEYDFDSGSDLSDAEMRRGRASEVAASSTRLWASNSNNHRNSPVKSKSTSFTSSTPKPSSSFLSNLTRRSNRIDNEVNNIKESEADDGPSFSRLNFPPIANNYRNFPPIRPTYLQAREPEKVSLASWIYQKAPYILLATFLVFLTVIGGLGLYWRYAKTSTALGKENVYPTCDHDNSEGTSCIPPTELAFAVSLYRDVHQTLKKRAVEATCGPKLPDGSFVQPFMKQRELVRYLLDIRPKDVLRVEAGVKHLALLLISNPHWGVAVLRADDAQATPPALCGHSDANKAVPSDIALELPLVFFAPCPDLSIYCRTKVFLYNSAFYIIASLIVGMAMYALQYFGRYAYYEAKKWEQEKMALVERIIKYVLDNCGPHQEFVAIRHVHDVLIPPKDRARMAEAWASAVDFLDKNESRVRREEQKVYNEEMMVWRLVAPPTTPPASPAPSPSPSVPSHPEANDNHLYPDLSSERLREGQRVWQGEAFETSAGSINSLRVSPTQCLKIRHMFQPSRFYGKDWEIGVRDAIIEKCEGVNLLHIEVDTESKEGCVYVKCSSAKEAGKAFGMLHGCWFDGALVTVKYLRLERYHERFPESIHATQPQRPSNNLRLSLGGQS